MIKLLTRANSIRIATAVLAIFTLTGTALAQQNNARGPIGESPYNVVSLWHKPFAEAGYAFGGNSGIFAETPNRILVAQRGETILPHPIPD
ncbi:MAG: hypothetical protein RL120_15000, partial [Gammaproteobacteria bacterium]